MPKDALKIFETILLYCKKAILTRKQDRKSNNSDNVERIERMKI